MSFLKINSDRIATAAVNHKEAVQLLSENESVD